ncbi:MAG: hypothetical protein UW18_C0003G0154 [Microgenomates group bacterium GW2011_GWF1_44_10]|nr:MAG: hypothetical protein UW18_C0003G0154 [Microgenomates group bacterium GW2011_GWF1_44_10]
MFFFGFLPLTLFIIKKQSEEEKLSHFSVLLPPILSLFLLSHPISLFFAVPLITIYCYVLYRESLHWKRSVVLCSIGVATSLWFWIPAYVERTFTTFISNNHFDEYLTHFPNPISYFWTANFSSIQYSAVLPHVTPGLTIYVVMVFAGILFFLNKKISRIFIVFFALFLLSILMQMRISTPLWEMISLLKNTQFPWRFLWISVIATSVLVAELVHLFRTHPHTQRIFLILVCASLLLSIRNFGNPRSFTKVVDNQWLLFGGTANAFDEHRPIWLNAASSREEHENVVLLSDSTERNEITPLDSKHIQTWDSTVHRYTVVLDKPTLIMEHTAYFPGWKVLVDGVETPINYTYEHSPGKLMFTVPAGTHAIESRFTEDTWDRILGDSLAIFGLMIYAVFVLVYIKTMIRTAKA